MSLLDLDPKLASIRGQLEGESLFIRNELHRSAALRKLHLEVAQIGSGLQILHCVFFPNPIFDAPIFGADVVAGPSGISAAIVDLSPVREELPTPVISLLEKISTPSFARVRELPAWGSIFSPYVHFIRPISVLEENSFLEVVDGYLNTLIYYLTSIQPDSIDSLSTIERYQRQCFYCLQQKRNDKTRNVLSKAFSPQWADRYIEMLLFDPPPHPKN